jgi:hypothetical protein
MAVDMLRKGRTAVIVGIAPIGTRRPSSRCSRGREDHHRDVLWLGVATHRRLGRRGRLDVTGLLTALSADVAAL